MGGGRLQGEVPGGGGLFLHSLTFSACSTIFWEERIYLEGGGNFLPAIPVLVYHSRCLWGFWSLGWGSHLPGWEGGVHTCTVGHFWEGRRRIPAMGKIQEAYLPACLLILNLQHGGYACQLLDHSHHSLPCLMPYTYM